MALLKRSSDHQLRVPAPRPATIARENGGRLPLGSLFPQPLTWVLAGGGAHGAVQLGSLQAVSETDIPVDALLGSSAGALTGAVIAEDPVAAASRLTYLWSDLSIENIIGPGWQTLLTRTPRMGVALSDDDEERISLEAVYRYQTFDELIVPFGAVATDYLSGEPVVLEHGSLIDALLASSAIPGVLPPVNIDDRWYIDALASANLPASLAMRRGAASLLVFDTGVSSSRDVGVTVQQLVPAINAFLSAHQRASTLSLAAEHIPVVYLPTPRDLPGTLSFSDSLNIARESYELARDFLMDLSMSYSTLKPGLYARPDVFTSAITQWGCATYPVTPAETEVTT